MVTPYFVLLLAIGLEHLALLRVSERNTRRLLEKGAVEYGTMYSKLSKWLGSVFIPACALEVILLHRMVIPLLCVSAFCVFLLTELVRYSSMYALGERWTFRTIAVPGARVETGGLYKFVRHPNHMAMLLQRFAIPLIHSAFVTAIVLGMANAVLLRLRTKCEERALTQHSDYGTAFGRPE